MQNVKLEGVQITTTHSWGDAGGVAGYCMGTLENCFVSGNVSSSSFRAGSVVGYQQGGSLTRCGSSATVVGTNTAGGVVGYAASGVTLTACYATGSVSGTIYYGGVVGYSYYSTLIACYATGNVNCTNTGTGDWNSAYAGGVAGWNTGPLTACYHATGTVSGQVIGGVAGKNSGALTACYWSDSPGKGIGDGTGEATQVDGTDVTWTEAITRMNTALSGTGWEYKPGDDGLPVPQKKQ